MTAGAATLLESIIPEQLGKSYSLNQAGGLDKRTFGELVKGRYRVETFSSAGEFAALLQTVKTNQAISTSLPLDGSVEGEITTKASLKDNPKAKTRSKQHMGHAARPGTILFDADAVAGVQSRTPHELRDLICKVCPGLRDAGWVLWSSGSSHLFNGEVEVQGRRGLHIHLLVQDVSDTRRVCGVIGKLLFLLGYGHIAVSSSGSMLVRGVFDESVADPARLIFAGGAVCVPPLHQQRGSPDVIDGVFADTRIAVPDLTADEDARWVALAEAAKAAKEPEAQAAREAWKAARLDAGVTRLVKANVPAGEAHERAKRTLESALGGVLMGDFELTLADGSKLDVTDAMNDPEKWHGADLRDPIEPEFQNNKVCAKLFLFGAVPTVHSFARGGRTWKLRRQPARIYVTKGRKSEVAREVLDRLVEQPDIYMRSRSLVMVNGGDIRPLDRHALSYELGLRIAFFNKGRDGDVPTDIGGDVVEMVMSAAEMMNTKEIKAVALLPYARPDGSIVDQPGYDSRTGVFSYFDADLLPPIPKAPTPEEVIAALKAVWEPWSAYQFATNEDRGAMLSAIVSAVCRPALDLCPGYFFDAPVQASGKTRAAGALGCVIRGQRGGITPFVTGAGADGEMSKKIVALLRGGEGAITIDNVVGRWSSPVLSSLITDGVFNDRVLGSSTWFKGDARIFITATGNNGEPDTDLGRRFIRVRIDPRCERPQARDFDFEPTERALRSRMAVAWGVLVLIAAHRAAGAPIYGKGGAGFEQWSSLVRQAVLHAGVMGYTEAAGIGVVGDPAKSIVEDASAADPEIEALGNVLVALEEGKRGEDFQVRELLVVYESGFARPDSWQGRFREGLRSLPGADRGEMTATRLGQYLKHRRDRVVGGLVLQSAGQHRGAALWKVGRIGPPPSA